MICLFFEWRLAVANRYCSSKGYGICAYPWVTFFFSGTYVSRWAGCRAAGGILVPYHAAGQILSAPAPGATEFYRPLTRTTTFLKTTWRFSGSNCSCGGWFMDVSGGLTYPLRYIEFFFYSKTHYDYLNIIASIVSHRIDPFPMGFRWQASSQTPSEKRPCRSPGSMRCYRSPAPSRASPCPRGLWAAETAKRCVEETGAGWMVKAGPKTLGHTAGW